MRCSRCETELADSATICPRCGTPTHTSVATTYSYLPADTPPWPTTIPQRQPQQVAAPPQVAAPTRAPTRWVRNLFVALAILVVTPLVGVGLTLGTLYAQGQFSSTPAKHVSVPSANAQAPATPTPATQGNSQTDQLPTPTSFKKTSSTDLNASLQYPSDWQAEAPQKDSSSNVDVNIHPTQHIGIDFQIIRLSANSSSQFDSADSVNQANLSSLSNAQGVHNLQTTTPTNTQPSIGGATWSQQDATFTNDNGTKFHIASIAVQHNKAYYTIIAYAPDMYYNEAMRKYIQPMLDSFQFLS